MKKIFLLITLFPLVFSAQILSQFPKNQIPYLGGYDAYYKDFREIIVERDLQPCTNPLEFYQFSVLIQNDGSINFIKDLHDDYLTSNKCASDLAREVAKYQTKWNPATVDGIKQPAVATFMIFPDDLFKSNQVNYSPIFTYPLYNFHEEKHLDHFKKQLLANIDVRRFRWDDIFTVEAEFIITKEGKMDNIVLTKKTGLEEFDRMIYYAFKSIKKKWKPATIKSHPIDFKFKYKLTAITDLAD